MILTKNKIGNTPLFHEVNKELHQSFTFELDSSKESKHYFCGPNWSESVIPNLLFAPFFPVGTAISTTFMTIDFISGDLFSCDRKLYKKLDGAEVAASRKRRILALPVKTEDPQQSINMIRSFTDNYGLTEDLIDIKAANRELTFFGIDNNKVHTFNSTSKEHLYSVAYKLRPTHLLTFERRGNTVTPSLIDLFTEKEIKKNTLAPFRVESDKVTQKSAFSKLASTFNFIPNSLTLSYKAEQEIETEHTPVGLNRHPDGPPIFLSMWGMQNITNPRQLSPWDYGFKFSPTLASTSFSHDGHNRTGESYNLKASRYSLTYDASFTLHTPAGAFWGSFGIGPSYTIGSDSDGNKFRDFNLNSHKVSFGNYFFFKDRFFCKIAYDSYHIARTELNNSNYKFEAVNEWTVSFGYFIPHIKYELRSLLP